MSTVWQGRAGLFVQENYYSSSAFREDFETSEKVGCKESITLGPGPTTILVSLDFFIVVFYNWPDLINQETHGGVMRPILLNRKDVGYNA